MRSPVISALILCLLTALGFGTGKPKPSQRIGDLVITLVGAEEPEHDPADRYPVVLRFRAENVGKRAICVSFGATLKATFGLEYHDFSFGPHALNIQELLPGESSEGEYDFLVKTGAEPLQVVLKPTRKSQTCDSGKDSSSSIWHGAEELTFSLSEPLGSNSQERINPDSSPERTVIRVFITGTTNDAQQANAIKVFNDRCPLAQITTAKDQANYLVQLRPTSFKQNKHVVVVTNQTGDVIHSGATFDFGNAVKDACLAMRNDLSAKAKQ
jgi:hypothetical protein